RLAEPIHDARLAVVGAHERLDAGPARPKPERGRELLLELEREEILMAARQEMERIPDAPDEVERALELGDVALGDLAERHQLPDRASLELELRHPERGVEVAQPALPFFQLGLEEVHRVPRPRVPLRALRELLLEERRRVLLPHLLDHLRFELGVERFVAG